MLFGVENREGRFVSDCRGRVEVICGGTVTDGGLNRGASDVLGGDRAAAEDELVGGSSSSFGGRRLHEASGGLPSAHLSG